MSFIDQLIDNAIRPDVRAAASYQVAEADGYIKLDAMENPYPLPASLRAELGRRLAEVTLNRYPAPSYGALKAALRATMAVPAGCELMLGNGSDELISLMATACARQDRRAVVLAPVPAFVMFPRAARLAGMDFVGVPLRADFTLDMEAMLAAIASHQPALLFLAYPNNPTGNLWDQADMLALIAALGATGVAVVDEAYGPFARRSLMPLLPRHPNMVVLRTLSKLGLAGLRLGYMAGAPALLEQFDKVRPPYNVNALSEAAALFALEHLDALDAQAALLRAERTRLAARLAALPGVHVFPSAANFLLIRVPDADDVHTKLLAARVLVKNMGKMHGVLNNCLRITVSTPEENSIFFDAVKASL